MSIGLPTRMSRREALVLLGALGVGTAASACAGPGSSSREEPTAAASTGKVGGEISFAHWRGEDRKVLQQIITTFTAAHDGTTVTQDIAPSQDYQRTALQRVRDGSVGDAFTAFRGAQFTNMTKAGVFTDLSKLASTKNYFPAYLEVGKDGDAQVGLPYQLVFNMPLCNLDLLERAGASEPPRDWDGFLALCDKLKALDVVPIIFPGGSLADSNQLMQSMVMNNAPADDMFARLEAGEYKCTDDWFVKTLEQYAQLRPYLQRNATGTQAEAAQHMFARGRGAIFVTGSYYIAVVRRLGAKFPIDLLAPVTVSADEAKYIGVHNNTFILGVNSASDNQATATAFVEYLSDPEVAGTYANGTAQHVTVEGVKYTDKDLQALEPWLKRKTLLAPLFQFNNLDVRGAVEGAAQQVIAGKKPAQAAERAQRIVDQNI